MPLPATINPYGEAARPPEGATFCRIPEGWRLALSVTVGAYVASVLRQGRNRLTVEELDALWPIYRREHERSVSAAMRGLAG